MQDLDFIAEVENITIIHAEERIPRYNTAQLVRASFRLKTKGLGEG
jgi:hypothetical protein